MFFKVYLRNNNECVKNKCNKCFNTIEIKHNNNIICGNIFDEYLLKEYITIEDYILAKNSIDSVYQSKNKSIIFCLQGWGTTSLLYDNLLSELTDKNDIIFLGFYGFGESAELPRVFSVGDYTKILYRILLLFCDCQISFFAHSFGGKIIWDLINNCVLKQDINAFFGVDSGVIKNIECDNIILNFDKILLTGSSGMKPRFSLVKKLKILKYKRLKKKCKKHPKLTKKLLKYGSNDYKNLKSNVLKQTFVNVVNNHTFSRFLFLCKNNKDFINKSNTNFELFSKIKWCIVQGKFDKDTPLFMAKKMHKIIGGEFHILNSGHYCFLYLHSQFNNIVLNFFST